MKEILLTSSQFEEHHSRNLHLARLSEEIQWEPKSRTDKGGAGPSGEYKGQTLKKNGLIWIEKGSGWHLAVQEEISYANENNKLKEEGSGQTVVSNNCRIKKGATVRREYKVEHKSFWQHYTETFLIIADVEDVNDDCRIKIKIQNVYVYGGWNGDKLPNEYCTDDNVFCKGNIYWVDADNWH